MRYVATVAPLLEVDFPGVTGWADLLLPADLNLENGAPRKGSLMGLIILISFHTLLPHSHRFTNYVLRLPQQLLFSPVWSG